MSEPRGWAGHRRMQASRIGSWACLALLALVLGCGDEPPVPDEPAFTAVAVLDGTDQGHSIWVKVLDENAQPIDGARVSIRLSGDSVREGIPLGPGEHRIDGLIDGIVPIAVEVAGRRHVLEHPVSNPHATLVLPVGGRLDIVWQAPQLAGLPEGDLVLVVAARLDPELRFEIDLDADGVYTGRVNLPYLLPGQYLASLELWRRPGAGDDDGAPESAATVVGIEQPVKILPLTQPRALWIEAGEVTQVVLGSPTVADKDRPRDGS